MFYVTADTHFFHRELLGPNDFAPRLFPDVETMNQTIVDHWNARVKPTDQVYLLGDIAMVPSKPAWFETVHQLLSQLNGQLLIVKGNHDNRPFLKYLLKHNQEITPGVWHYQETDVGHLIKANHCQYFMTHYPLLLGKVSRVINLHGHIHHSMLPIAENINVGIDAPERELLDQPPAFGAPLALAEIEAIYQAKQRYLAQLSQKSGKA